MFAQGQLAVANASEEEKKATEWQVRGEAPQFRRGPVSQGPKAPGAKLASEKQRDLLRDMLREREGQEGVQALRDRLNAAREGGYLTTAIFTEVFDALKAIPKAEVVGIEPEVPGVWSKINEFPGDCNQCGRKVAAGAGRVARSDEDKWVVWHAVCPSDFPFPEGRYAIENADDELRFYHLIDGEVFVMASDTEYLIHGTSAEAIIAKIGEDPLEAAKRYGIEIGACGVCGRTLTSDWRLVGIGPVCSQKAFA